MQTVKAQNPILYSDFPDPDVIKAGDTYYMATTTMHFMPGCAIMRSYDLAHWEFAGHVYDALEDYDAARLENNKTIYGSGMWAPCLRYEKGIFYVLFIANDTHKTYLYSSAKIEGPWIKKEVKGFYYDASLLFDDDGKKYIVHGNRNISITQLEDDLSGPKAGGLNKIILQDSKDIPLGYEGSHIYKINGKYYLFNIHWPRGGMRTESCFMADKLDGKWTGKDVLSNDMFYHGQGVAQGGIVEGNDGNWYAVLFQDRGAAGRMPVLVKVTWKNGFPEFGAGGFLSDWLNVTTTKPDYKYGALFCDDDFNYNIKFGERKNLNHFWEWNHIPDDENWACENGKYIIRTKDVVSNPVRAKNTLTQRLSGGKNITSVEVDGSKLSDGDYAGLCAFQSCYAFAGLKKEGGKIYVVMGEKKYGAEGRKENRSDSDAASETEKILLEGNKAVIRMETNFTDMADTVSFSYATENKGSSTEWKKIGKEHKLYFMLDHFTGCRAGLFMYSTETAGGQAAFSGFRNGEVK